MKDINKIIDSLSPVEQNLMYNALQKKLNRGTLLVMTKVDITLSAIVLS